MPGAGRGDLGNRAYRRVRKAMRDRARLEGTPCMWCGNPFDWDAAPRTPRSFSVEHVTPRSEGGALLDPDNMAPAHFGCNSSRGARALPGATYTTGAAGDAPTPARVPAAACVANHHSERWPNSVRCGCGHWAAP